MEKIVDESESVRGELDERIGTAVPTEDFGGQDRLRPALWPMDNMVDNRWEGRGTVAWRIRANGDRV